MNITESNQTAASSHVDVLEVDDDLWGFFGVPAGDKMFRAWLVRDGVTVGYAHGRYGKDEFGISTDSIVDMHDVETRGGNKNQGVMKSLTNLLKAHYGVDQLQHSGGYTEDGKAFFSKYCYRPENADEPKVFGACNFVHDWDERYAM